MTKKILLADDSLTIQKVVELTFSDSGYELICVPNGQKALEWIQQDRPDLVLADVVMPEKNGYEVCEAIKSNPATAKIPVMLLSGTFEPFDRERAERIGADAIVSKPFDSQQLIAQVEALLDASPPGSGARATPQSTAPMAAATAPEVSTESEEGPFDVGFSAEDFTASIRMPPRGMDPFEEEYVRGDPDSAIEQFEKTHPERPAERVAEPPPVSPEAESSAEAPPPWLHEETEKPAEPEPALEAEPSAQARTETQPTLPVPMPSASPESVRADEAPTEEVPAQTVAMKLPAPEMIAPSEPRSEARKEESFFDSSREPAAQVETAEPEFSPAASRSEAVSREIEVLAQKSSIPELTQMLSSVTKSGGNDWSDEQIEKLARRVVERLSDRVVREIAWEVIPDMAEVVIKKRIKELEADTE